MDDTTIKERKATTVLLEPDSYSLILNKQTEIFNKTNKRISIQELVSESVKKGMKLNKTDLESLIYKEVIKILEPLENSGKYKGNSHHLTQLICENVSFQIISEN